MFIEKPATTRSIALRKPIHGVGINDSSYLVHLMNNNRVVNRCPYYKTWENMISRCYRANGKETLPTYEECYVSEEWLVFSVFRKWMAKQDWKGKQLDKDIKVIGNKIYSKDTCLFVTKQINLLLNDRKAARGSCSQGVSKKKGTEKYVAQCGVNGKPQHLGYFSTDKEASKTYRAFKKALIKIIANEPENSGIKNHLLQHADLYQEQV